MFNKIKNYVGIGLGTVMAFALTLTVSAQEPDYPGDVGDALASMVDDIADVIFTNLPVVFAVIAALMGLTFLVRYIRRWIGGARG